jgi:hypothetical protein
VTVTGLTLEDRITARLQASDYRQWREKVTAIGGCAKPIRLFGCWQAQDLEGQVLAHHGGAVFVPCGNRRASVCPTCSDRYAADAFHLVRAGLAGGTKGVPESVTDKPRVFATLTPPSFGPVHNAFTSHRGRRVPCTACREFHHPADPRIGTPADPDSYDYAGAVLWQANAGELWHRFTIALRRKLARAAGLTMREFTDHARVSYGKVAEYQRRGLVHFHAVIRIDGPDGPGDPTPAWVTTDLLADCIRQAAASVTLTATRPGGHALPLVWGDQVDIRAIRATHANQVEDERGEISEQRLAGYVAKYATKGTGKTEAADRPIRSQLDIDCLAVSEHHRTMIQTAWNLGGRAEYDGLNLRKWAHMLGFRGHFLTKSKHYSTTFKTIRSDRHAWRTAETLDRLGLDPEAVIVVNDWQFTGAGYDNDAERELAAGIAERTRQARQRNYEREVGAE